MLRGQVRTAAGAPAARAYVELAVFRGGSCAGTPVYHLHTVTRVDGTYAATLGEFADGRLPSCVVVGASTAAGAAARAEVAVTIVAERETDLGTIALGAS